MFEKRSTDEEKAAVTEAQVEHREAVESRDDEDPRIAAFTPEERKRIIRRIDIRLVITLGVLYCVSLMDRGNLSAAVIAGMSVELDMNAANSGYSIVSLVFFISYTIFQPPATIVIRRIGPHRFLSAIVLAWGAVMIGFGFVPNWQTMAILRVLLGALEAGFYPGSVYLLSTWFPRYQLQKRNAAFFLIGNSSIAFGGILAYGLMQMNGLGGLSGWRWIFVIEGIVTCLLGIFSYFIIVDFPEDAAKCRNFLNQKEVDFVIATIDRDRSDTETVPFDFRQYLRCACDTKVWAFSAMFMLTTTNTYALTYFAPIILRNDMGFSTALTLCIGAAPFVAAAIYMFVQAYFSDKWRLRGPIIVFNCAVGILGTALLGYTHNNGSRFFGLFLTASASAANCPAILTYQANNIRGQWKRALASATLIGGGAIGGIIGTTVFREQDAPSYIPGIIACLLAYSLVVLITALLTVKFWRANKRAEKGGKPIEGLVGFRYTF
ncbi:hypothetical protein VTO42DRAFT_7993 [Malbranchea cinnamomea]